MVANRQEGSVQAMLRGKFNAAALGGAVATIIWTVIAALTHVFSDAAIAALPVPPPQCYPRYSSI